MKETEKDIRKSIKSLRDEVSALRLKSLKNDISALTSEKGYSEDLLKDYLVKKQVALFNSKIAIKGTIAYINLIDPHHLVVIAKVKSCTPDDSSIFYYLAYLLNRSLFGNIIKFHIDSKIYFIPRQNLKSEKNDEARFVMFIFKDHPWRRNDSSVGLRYFFHIEELYKLISVGNLIKTGSTLYTVLIHRRTRPQFIEIIPGER